MDGLLYYEGLLYIPDGPCRLQVFQFYHDFLPAGYFGSNKTMELIFRDFWWPQIWKLLSIMLRHMIYSRSKIPRHRLYRLLCQLPIPKKPWASTSMDFITDLPSSKDFDSIFVVVDRLTKMAYFMPYNKTITCEETARFFMDNIYKYHGLPDNIIFDCGS
jgi:hypothetical protein